MAKYHGKNAHFSADAVDLSTFLDSIDWPEERDTAETSTFGQDAKTYVVGLTGSTVDIGGKWDDTAVTGADVVLSAMFADEDPVALIFGPSGNASGRRKYTANGYLTSYQTSAPIGDVIAFTASFQITGPVTRGVFAP